jgi:hypothetical protein
MPQRIRANDRADALPCDLGASWAAVTSPRGCGAPRTALTIGGSLPPVLFSTAAFGVPHQTFRLAAEAGSAVSRSWSRATPTAGPSDSSAGRPVQVVDRGAPHSCLLIAARSGHGPGRQIDRSVAGGGGQLPPGRPPPYRWQRAAGGGSTGSPPIASSGGPSPSRTCCAHAGIPELPREPDLDALEGSRPGPRHEPRRVASTSSPSVGLNGRMQRPPVRQRGEGGLAPAGRGRAADRRVLVDLASEGSQASRWRSIRRACRTPRSLLGRRSMRERCSAPPPRRGVIAAAPASLARATSTVSYSSPSW